MPTARRLWIDLLIILCVLTWAVTIWAYLDRPHGVLLGAAIASTVIGAQVAIAVWLNDRHRRRHARTMAQLAGVRQAASGYHSQHLITTRDLAVWSQQLSAKIDRVHSAIQPALDHAHWTGFAECAEDLKPDVVPLRPRGSRN